MPMLIPLAIAIPAYAPAAAARTTAGSHSRRSNAVAGTSSRWPATIPASTASGVFTANATGK
jgi:hypothetical protein